MNSSLTIELFVSVDTNPGATLQKFDGYVEQIELLFQSMFRKSYGTLFDPSDSDKKVMLLYKEVKI